MKPKKRSLYISGELTGRAFNITPREVHQSPMVRLSADWETDQLQQALSVTTARISDINKESFAELNEEITNI